ncbi:MAG: hypothetical protein CL610_18880 [Anaerolineaceae bacterium]|nr:hypothetical protein [Anaerolineaceae bacterium]
MPKYSRFLSTLWRRLNTWLANVEDILDALDHARMEDADPLHTLRLLRYRYQQLIKWMYAALAALSVAVALAFAVDTPLDDLLLGRPVENRPVACICFLVIGLLLINHFRLLHAKQPPEHDMTAERKY